MTTHPLNTVFHFSAEDEHPPSQIVGIDHYTCQAEDGSAQTWPSYTLVPISPEDRKGDYERWYVVDMPQPQGMTVFYLVNEGEFQETSDKALKISGKVSVQTDGDAELGTGTGQLDCYLDTSTNPPTIFSKEIFEGIETLYFKAIPLKGSVKAETAPTP